MTDLNQISQLCVSVATLVTAIGGVILAIKHNQHSEERKEEIKTEVIKTVKDESCKVQEATNGVVDKLVQTTAVAAKQEGVLEEKARTDRRKSGV
jgi:hypothetical protein